MMEYITCIHTYVSSKPAALTFTPILYHGTYILYKDTIQRM